MVDTCLAEEQVDRVMFHFGVWAEASQGCGYLGMGSMMLCG